MKHNTAKRTTAAILTLLTLIPLLISCASDDGTSAQTAANDTTAANAETTAAETELVPDLDVDYDGAEVHLLIPNWSLYEHYYIAEEQNGDVLNDAIFDRKLATEEALNVKIKETMIGDASKAGINQIHPKIKESVLTGSGDYDLAMTHCITHLINITTEKLVLDWNSIGNVNFDNPWWNSMMNETMSVNGKLLFAASDYIIPDPNAILFNKEILEAYSLESPYDYVYDGKWTWDKLTEMSRKVSKDLNGDGKYDGSDEYGYFAESTWLAISVMYACDQFMLKDDGEHMVLDINNEKMVKIVEMYYDLCLGSPSSLVKKASQMTDAEKNLFDNGQALFHLCSLNKVKQKRELEIDFGILPYAKYDEAQDEYISNNWAGLMCIPIDAPDPDMTGAVSEYLAYESRKKVMPIYYDALLNTKFARDEESKDMLDIIFSNSAYDIGLCYSNFNRLLYTLVYTIDEKTRDFASYYAKEEASVQASYDSVFAVYYED